MFPAYFIFPSSILTKASSKLWLGYGYTYERGREKDRWEVWICLGYFQTLNLRSYLHPMENSEIVLFRNKAVHISLFFFFLQYSSFFITRDICIKTVFFFFFNLGNSSASADYPLLPLSFWSHYLLIALHLQPSHRGRSSHQDSPVTQGKESVSLQKWNLKESLAWAEVRCLGPVWVTAHLSHGCAWPLLFLLGCSQVFSTDSVWSRVGGGIFLQDVYLHQDAMSFTLPTLQLLVSLDLLVISLDHLR